MKGLISTAIILLSLAAFAQDGAYIVTTSGDTLRNGKIIGSSLNSISYVVDGELKKYSHLDLKAYKHQDQKLFVSGISDSSFVEALVLGRASLYRSNKVFILEKDQDIRVLQSSEGEIVNGVIRGTDRRWQGILTAMTSDCDSNRKISDRIGEKTLTEYVTSYNKCIGADYSEVKEKTNYLDFRPFVALAAASSDYQRTVDLFSGYSSSYIVGMGAMFSSPRFSSKLQFGIEFLYSKAELGVDNVGVLTTRFGTISRNLTGRFDVTTMHIPVSIYYPIANASKFQLFIGGGSYFAINSSSSKIFNQQGNQVDIGDNINGFQIGYSGKILARSKFEKINFGLSVEYVTLPELEIRGLRKDKLNHLIFKLLIFPELGTNRT